MSELTDIERLYLACNRGDLDKVRELIQAEPGLVNQTSANKGWTPLHHAVRNGQNGVVSHLLSKGADPNIKEKTGNTAMHYASFYGSHATVQLLLQNEGKPADINAKDYDDITPLHVAVAYASNKFVDYLMQQDGIDKNPHSKQMGSTPLMQACFASKFMVSYALVKGGADVKTRDNSGNTALHFATQAKNEQIVDLLLDAGADANVTNNERMTPLDVAKLIDAPARLQKTLDSKTDREAVANQDQRVSLVQGIEAMQRGWNRLSVFSEDEEGSELLRAAQATGESLATIAEGAEKDGDVEEAALPQLLAVA
eukprot:Clim_evm26s172 gene=Clim_evmTU26s172